MKPALGRSPDNILLIQLGDIGDVVLTTPTLRAVKESCPDSNVSILVRKPFGALLVADPAIREVIESEKYRGSLSHRLQKYAAFAQRLRRARYDLVISLRTGDSGAIFSFLTGAQNRVGCQGIKKQFWHKLLFTHVIHDLKVAPPPVHPGADQSLRVVREIGMDTADSTPKLHVAAPDLERAREILAEAGVSPEAGMITINPYSRWKYKEWSNEKWGVVLDRIWEAQKLPSVLIGSQQEAAGCQEIAAGRKRRAFSLAGKTTLGELAAVLSLSRLHLGVDSAAPHIAAALGTPTVTIHGPTDWRGWRAISDKQIVISPAMDCVPCSQMGCSNTGQSKCLEQLTADTFIQEVDARLKNLFF